jgi:Ni,Fe-hydrogenase maturation factor
MNELKTDPRVLLVGIGNRNHGDDGLGWIFVNMIDSLGYDFLDFEYRDQLQVEDAKLVSEYDVVVFADASYQKFGGGFEISRCLPAKHSFYSTQAQVPAAILFLANDLYKKLPKAYIISISGEEWEEQSLLSDEGSNNLQAAVEFFDEQLLPSLLAVTV